MDSDLYVNLWSLVETRELPHVLENFGILKSLSDYIPDSKLDLPIYRLEIENKEFSVHLGAVSLVTEIIRHGKLTRRIDAPQELLENVKHNRYLKENDAKYIDAQVEKYRTLRLLVKVVERIPLLKEMVRVELLILELEINRAAEIAAKRAISWSLAMNTC